MEGFGDSEDFGSDDLDVAGGGVFGAAGMAEASRKLSESGPQRTEIAPHNAFPQSFAAPATNQSHHQLPVPIPQPFQPMMRPTGRVMRRKGLGDPDADPVLSTGNLLGLGILLPTAGLLVGLKYDGFYGGLGGSLAAGSLINVYRSVKYMLRGTPEDDKEAIISGTYAAIGLGVSTWLILKGLKAKKANKNEDDESDNSLRGVK